MNKETIDIIYDLVVAYLPVATAIFTSLLTFVKFIQGITASKEDNKLTRDQVKLLIDENGRINQALAETNKKLNRMMNKQEKRINDKEV